jgi:hypothetical protein
MCGCNKAKKAAAAAASAPPPPRQHAVVVPRTPVAPVVVSRTGLATVNTQLWGPSLWKALHTAAQFAGDSSSWSSILSAMTTGLPCPECSAHYNTWYRRQKTSSSGSNNRMYIKLPFMGNRTARRPPQTPSVPITIKLLNLHNEINQRLGQPSWSSEQLAAAYGGDKQSQKVAAIAALQTLNGVIGRHLYTTLMAVLLSL